MTHTRTFKLIRVVFLALVATVASAGLLSAENYTGTFTLPFEVRWGTAVLPAGDYSFTIDVTKSPHFATVRGGNGAVMIMARGLDDRQVTGRSELILVRRGIKRTVRALRLAKEGLVFSYSAPKGEPPLLAQGPELLQRIPVMVSGK